ncbi:MAG TPA: phosphotransferase family protein, partial [Actinomycetota bacterium]|nr:phosphotransferase family protein [Actinomycetota bacterium]
MSRHQAGHSNETFFVRRDDHQWVLRRPPAGAFLPTAHDVLREHRVLAALRDTPVRTPVPILACDDASVIGAPFFLMEKVDGHVLRDELPEGFDQKVRHRVAEKLVDALVELHSVDWRAVGLDGWGRPDGYLERQLKRWSGQLELTMPLTRRIPELMSAGEWLASNIPPSPPATIVHGDYKLDNVIVDED